MEQLSIRQVAAWTGGIYEGPDLRVSGIAIDSRSAGRGDLFVPLRGAMQDGHEFIGEAFASGASAALVDRPDVAQALSGLGRAIVVVPNVRLALASLASAYRDFLDIKVIGITGSNGKTTTKEMLRVVLGARAAVSPRSYNNDIGVPLTLLSATRHHRYCVVEMGSNGPGEIASLARIARPDVGIVLNVSESHLQGLGDLDGVAQEKEALVRSLPATGCAILNWDDVRVREMMGAVDCCALTFGTWEEADVFASDIRTRGIGVSFLAFDKQRVRLKAYGLHNVHNALAAATAAMWLGEHACDVFERLEAFRPAPMRMEVEDIGRIRLINDAYNANPTSTKAAIQEVSVRAGMRRIVVLGDMLELGETSPELHARVGRAVANAKIDQLWAIGPKSEVTARAARDAGLKTVYWSPDVPTAMAEFPIRPRSGDVILFKASRGVRLERVYEDMKAHITARRRKPISKTATQTAVKTTPNATPAAAPKTTPTAAGKATPIATPKATPAPATPVAGPRKADPVES